MLIARGVVLSLLLALAAPARADVIRVPADMPTIQAGIDSTASGDMVLVADGIYTGPGNKNLDFAGKLITVISENGPLNCVIDCEQDGRGVFFHSGETEATVFSGFTIRNGHVDLDSPGSHAGGGILFDLSSPTVSDCIIDQNVAEGAGGGIHCRGSSPIIENCIVSGNIAFNDGGGLNCADGGSPLVIGCVVQGNEAMNFNGGGLRCVAGANPLYIDCTIRDNICKFKGGGSRAREADPQYVNCTFERNRAGTNGGGISLQQSSSVFSHCTIRGNIAGTLGGGVQGGRWLLFDNCRIHGNRALAGGGLALSVNSRITFVNCTISQNDTALSGGGLSLGGGEIVMINSILWDNRPDGIDGDGTTLFSFTVIEGTFNGFGNVDADPLFVDPLGPDGRYGTEDDDLRLQPGSPCIDVGDNAAIGADVFDLDLDGNTQEPVPVDVVGRSRVIDDPDSTDGCPADLDDDGDVDLDELMLLLETFGSIQAAIATDLNRDGRVDLSDLALLLSRFGTTCDTPRVDIGALEFQADGP